MTADNNHNERDYLAQLGQRIRAVREERDLTQMVVAQRAGIGMDMVSRLENGRYTRPGLPTLLRLAQGIGVRLEDLLPDSTKALRTGSDPALMAKLDDLAQQASPRQLRLLVAIATAVLTEGRS